MDINRRKFILGSVAIIAAPAIVKAENIMKIWMPKTKKIYIGDEWIVCIGVEVDSLSLGFIIGGIIGGKLHTAPDNNIIGPKLR